MRRDLESAVADLRLEQRVRRDLELAVADLPTRRGDGGRGGMDASRHCLAHMWGAGETAVLVDPCLG